MGVELAEYCHTDFAYYAQHSRIWQSKTKIKVPTIYMEQTSMVVVNVGACHNQFDDVDEKCNNESEELQKTTAL